jgi:molybdenum cofactor cytidylyltransferase
MVSGIIMASGFSRRMGRDKLLLEINGRPVVDHVIRAAVSSSLNEVILVYRNTAVKSVADRYGIKTAWNRHAAKGQSASVVKGITVANPEARAFLFMVGDQPYLDGETIDRILDVHAQDPDRIVVPVYAGKPGNPVLFPRFLEMELRHVRGDVGGRSVIKAHPDIITHVPIGREIVGRDVDNPDDFDHVQLVLPKKELGLVLPGKHKKNGGSDQ